MSKAERLKEISSKYEELSRITEEEESLKDEIEDAQDRDLVTTSFDTYVMS